MPVDECRDEQTHIEVQTSLSTPEQKTSGAACNGLIMTLGKSKVQAANIADSP